MAKKRTAPRHPPSPPLPASRPAVTAERFRRLVRLIEYLGEGPQTREGVLAHLEQDVRGFYRDLELLRTVGIPITLEGGGYCLAEGAGAVLQRLPFPDPHLTLGEARQLARGRGKAQQRIRGEIEELLTAP